MDVELKVTALKEVTTTNKDKTDETQYVMTAAGKDGMPKITITRELPFDGYDYDSPVKIKISNPQTTLKK